MRFSYVFYHYFCLKEKDEDLKFHLFNTLNNLEIVAVALICNHAFTFLKYPVRGPELAAAPYSTQKSSVLPLYEVSSYLNHCVTEYFE